ncbi:hypothetical protein BS46_gp157 [Acinetobacter phage BS46]|nr:hypothetical protein BS46_gp157 [Acinetobacter phage BS46]
MSELQDLYESINPIPENLSRCGDGYCQHVYILIDPYASGYKDRFEGFKQGLQHQQSKVCSLEEQVEELQKRVEWLENRLKATDTLSKMRAAVIGSFKTQEFNARTRRKMMILKKAEQALKGEG